MAVGLLAIAAWFELFDGTQCIAMGAIRGLKDARTTFLVGLAGYWLVGVPLACLLAFPLGWGTEWRLVGPGRRPGLRGHRPDPGLRVEDLAIAASEPAGRGAGR